MIETFIYLDLIKHSDIIDIYNPVCAYSDKEKRIRLLIPLHCMELFMVADICFPVVGVSLLILLELLRPRAYTAFMFLTQSPADLQWTVLL